MKNIKLIMLFALGVVLASSCKEDEFKVYDSDTRIYFSWAGADTNKNLEENTMLVYFSRYTIDDKLPDAVTVGVPVTIIGRQAGYDRPIAYEIDYERCEEFVDAPFTTAKPDEDFEMLPSYIAANESTGYINLKLLNSERLSEAKDKGLNIMIRLLPNEHFAADFDAPTRINKLKDSLEIKTIDEISGDTTVVYKIRRYNSLLGKLNYNNLAHISVLWIPGIKGSMSGMMNGLFGAYSIKKSDFICSSLGFPLDFFDPDLEALNLDPTEYMCLMTSGKTSGSPNAMLMMSWQATVKLALNNYKSINGGFPIDENGNEIKLPGM